MMSKYVLLLGGLIGFSFVHALEYHSTTPPNTYRHSDNPHYWKNKKPFSDYWQQDVEYTINVKIDEQEDLISGQEKLVYWNNSPDTLREVYFHLYQNAFTPGSYYHNLYENNGIRPTFGKHEKDTLGTEIETLLVNGKEAQTELDNTILKVWLPEPLLPDHSVQFDIDFTTYYGDGSIRRRMKYFMSYGKKQYNGCHWYPRISCYDRKFGWTVDQHLGREFYGDFGTYDVTLDFPSNYIVAATGYLLNREEMLPDTLMEKLAVENFKDKPWGEKPSVIIPYVEGERKKWHYYAENVHDFAFTANPHYRIGVAEYKPKAHSGIDADPVKAYSFVQEPHASGWQNAAEYTAKTLRVFSEDFGMYGYHKMIVADARDGMEYPMLTLDGGKDPSYRDLLVHEIGHNWFYGMVNNNETYRAMMDEGFTQFLTAWGLQRIDGQYLHENTPDEKYVRKHRWPIDARDSEIYYGYLRDATRNADPPLNTHSDGFHGALRHGGGYGHVYYKTAAMLYNLQYLLGDTLFLESMQYYFDTWSFCHPYPEDFRQAIIDYAKTDLNWFFDQWLETTKHIDYSIEKVKKKKNTDNTFLITFKRKGRMQMPIDFRVVDEEGRTFDYHIPNQLFEKQTNAVVLPKWTGWDKLNPTYTAEIQLPEAYPGEPVKIDRVIIDPTERLADVNMLDNRTKNNVKHHFDAHIWNFPDWRHYHVFWRPDIWWNGYDGWKAGLHVEGNYMKLKHKFSLTVWGNTTLLPYDENNAFEDRPWYQYLNYNFQYQTPLDRFLPQTDLYIKSRYLDGLVLMEEGIVKRFPANIDFHINVKTMVRPGIEDLSYLLYPDEWKHNTWNNSLNVGFTYPLDLPSKHIDADLYVNGRTSITNDGNYQYIEAAYKSKRTLWRFDLKTRVYGRYGTNQGLPAESALYFSQASPEEMMENKYTRSFGFWPNDWVTPFGAETGHFHYGGGLNMRGYAGYAIVVENEQGEIETAYKGSSGLASNLQLNFDRIIRIKSPGLRSRFDIDTYLFGDAGMIVYQTNSGGKDVSEVRFDAGAGLTFTVKKWWKLSGIKPLTIRFDVPFYVSHAPAVEENLDFRWVLGINKAF